jgi:hypothetical protein
MISSSLNGLASPKSISLMEVSSFGYFSRKFSGFKSLTIVLYYHHTDEQFYAHEDKQQQKKFDA